MKDISIRKIASLAQSFINGLGYYNVAFVNNSANNIDMNLFITNASGIKIPCKDNPIKANVKAVIIGTDDLREIEIETITYNNNNQRFVFSKSEIANVVKYEHTNFMYKVFFQDLMSLDSASAAVAQTSSTPTQARTVPAPITHRAGVILVDAGKNKYKINGEYSFDYTPAGSSSSTTITSGSKFRTSDGWNQAVVLINGLNSANQTTETSKPGANTVAPKESAAPAKAPAETATTPAAPAPPAPTTPQADASKAIDGLKKILSLAASNSLKIDTKGFDFKSESKVWRGVIKGYGGANEAADACLAGANFSPEDLKLLSEVADTKEAEVSGKITMQTCLKKINDFFYKIKNTYSKRFLGITVATEEQIAKAVKKGLSGGGGKAKAASLAQLNLLSKVAARRERAKKSLDSAIEKEASVEDDMTSKVEKRRAAARAKLGL